MVAPRVALETTLLVHGVPQARALPLLEELSTIVRRHQAVPSLCGVLRGDRRWDLTAEELAGMLAEGAVAKANTANLGILCHAGRSAATTVSGTMELAAEAGIHVFATGGIGGVHRGYGTTLDISADLTALARFPVAVVTSGVKAILDVEATREALESLGVPVVGVGTDCFPAFTVRESNASVDARFDSLERLRDFLKYELARTGRGVVVANPIPETAAIAGDVFQGWCDEAAARVTETGRAWTPAMLSTLVEISGGESLAANLALIRNNASVAAQLAF